MFSVPGKFLRCGIKECEGHWLRLTTVRVMISGACSTFNSLVQSMAFVEFLIQHSSLVWNTGKIQQSYCIIVIMYKDSYNL